MQAKTAFSVLLASTLVGLQALPVQAVDRQSFLQTEIMANNSYITDSTVKQSKYQQMARSSST